MPVLRRLANLFCRSSLDREIAAELQSHIELRMEANLAAGMSQEDARRDALLHFGNPAVTKERVAASDAALALAGFGRDIRYSLRQLRRSPGFAFTAILTLAVGIGANVVVFGVLNALILRPLNVADPERLVQIVHKEPGYDSQSYPDYLDFRSRNVAFADMATQRIGEAGLSVGGSAQRIWHYEVSANYFDMLGIQPILGRFFHPSDDRGPNSAPYVVLSEAFWRTRFNADPRVIGMIVDLNKHPFTIIGVAPGSFNGTELFLWPDLWVPIINEEQIEGYSFLQKRYNHGIFVIGSLKPGVTTAQATDNLNSIARQLAREHPAEDDGLSARLVRPGLLGDTLGRPTRAFMAGIMVLTLLVLLAACVNLAGIFAVRSADRTREIAIRLSIGSSRGRIMRQLLTEAVVVSIAGGAAGTAVALVQLSSLTRWQPIPEFPIHVSIAADARVFALAVALSVASGILPALFSARQVWLTNTIQAIKSGGTSVGRLHGFTLRDALLAFQIAVCALLVTASLVSLRGMERSLHAPVGFNPEGVTLADFDMKMAGYSDKSAFAAQRRMIEEASRIPGVVAVGTINDRPLNGGGSSEPVFREGATDFRGSNSLAAPRFYNISPGYLNAAGTKLLAGRDFAWSDDEKKPRVALVNQTLARILFGNSPAVGGHFAEPGGTRVEIIGVVEDGKYESLTEDKQPAMFFSLAQNNEANTSLVVRSGLSTADAARALHGMLNRIDSSLPLRLNSWSEALALVLFPARVATAALGVMGLLAAMLSITGVFGMAAYSVSKRVHELGIRVALGAHRPQIMRAALGRPVVVLISGSVAGLILGVLASRLLAALVYEATPRDPLVLLGAVAAMSLIGVIATSIPARRALAINPAQLLREE